MIEIVLLGLERAVQNAKSRDSWSSTKKKLTWLRFVTSKVSPSLLVVRILSHALSSPVILLCGIYHNSFSCLGAGTFIKVSLYIHLQVRRLLFQDELFLNAPTSSNYCLFNI